ncbi:hypothetical protein BIW11_11987 [Tropilaelaps mercedesae]|uniref:ZP domain-containing protein n=1 Tax=Tropilaelaps mercedesae TaxID=418985 RepID=A0A1V9X8P1_9ACAR|nr:hypothetical protein BIW11_11987 [Tropilaelaps mercedesae]
MATQYSKVNSALIASIIIVHYVLITYSSPISREDTTRTLPKKTIPKNSFKTDRNSVELQCEPEDFVVKVNFTQPFRGIVHAGPKSNKCLLRGDGGEYYTLRIPLDGCGTIHNEGRFSNTLTIRFHPSLELEGDELKTLVCRFKTEAVLVK